VKTLSDDPLPLVLFHYRSLVHSILFLSSKSIAKISSWFWRYPVAYPWFPTLLGGSGAVPYSHWYGWYEIL